MKIVISLNAHKMLQVAAIYGVMKFYNMLRAGISWKGPETIELWYQRPGCGVTSDTDDQRDDDDDEDDDEDTLLLPYGSSSDSDESLCDFV